MNVALGPGKSWGQIVVVPFTIVASGNLLIPAKRMILWFSGDTDLDLEIYNGAAWVKIFAVLPVAGQTIPMLLSNGANVRLLNTDIADTVQSYYWYLEYG